MPQASHGRGQLVARLFGILGAFTPERPWLNLSDLSRRTALPVPTVHRLATQLVAFGALERSEDGRYGIGINLWQIGLVEPRGLELRDVARPLLHQLQERTGCTASLSVLDGADAVVIEQVQHLRAGSERGVGLGRRAPARMTPEGRVLAAYRADADDLGTPEQRILLAIRRTGIAVDDGRRRNHPFSLAVPVRGSTGTVVAALSVEGPAAAGDPKAAARELRAGADAISRALGSRSGDGQGRGSRQFRFTSARAAGSALSAGEVGNIAGRGRGSDLEALGSAASSAG